MARLVVQLKCWWSCVGSIGGGIGALVSWCVVVGGWCMQAVKTVFFFVVGQVIWFSFRFKEFRCLHDQCWISFGISYFAWLLEHDL